MLLKIVREESSDDEETAAKANRRNETLDYCPGNEIAVYNGTHSNGSFLMWSFCDATHSDINNIQVGIYVCFTFEESTRVTCCCTLVLCI